MFCTFSLQPLLTISNFVHMWKISFKTTGLNHKIVKSGTKLAFYDTVLYLFKKSTKHHKLNKERVRKVVLPQCPVRRLESAKCFYIQHSTAFLYISNPLVSCAEILPKSKEHGGLPLAQAFIPPTSSLNCI